jgi:predicted transcriptional regulator
MASILDAAAKENKIGITKLMYAAQLPYRHVLLHIQPLLKEQLLEYDNQNKTYAITNKGRQFLELYGKLVEMIR